MQDFKTSVRFTMPSIKRKAVEAMREALYKAGFIDMRCSCSEESDFIYFDAWHSQCGRILDIFDDVVGQHACGDFKGFKFSIIRKFD